MTINDLFASPYKCWTTREIAIEAFQSDNAASVKKAERWNQEQKLAFFVLDENSLKDEHERTVRY